MNKKIGLMLGILFLLNIFVVCAVEDNLIASIDKPKMVLYKNFTGETFKFQESVIAINDNDFDVNIMVKPLEGWEDNIVVEEPEFILKAGERKEVFYTVTIDEAKYYSGDILVNFKNPDSNAELALVQRLIVDIKVVSGDNKITGNATCSLCGSNSVILLSSTLVIALFFVMLLTFLFKKTKEGIEIVPEGKGNKKEEKKK